MIFSNHGFGRGFQAFDAGSKNTPDCFLRDSAGKYATTPVFRHFSATFNIHRMSTMGGELTVSFQVGTFENRRLQRLRGRSILNF
ncbi:hypothetical protein GGR01_000354 [Acetobacter oeni]|nr:hypothetical protein [Acetobacter oeni]